MKHAWIAALMAVLAAGQASAGSMTYEITNHPADQNGATLSGYIITDGVIGNLAAGDITSWSWTITPAGGAPLTYSSSDTNATAVLVGVVVASQSAITIGAATTGDPVNDFALFNHVTHADLEYYRLTYENSYYGFNDTGGVWINDKAVMGGTEPWVIATASAPEPSTLTLLGLGAIGLVVAARRKVRVA